MSHEKKKNVQSFERWEVEMVNKRARSLIGKYGITDTDLDDIQQEMFVALLKTRESYLQDHEQKIIVRRILDDKASDYFRKSKTQKRSILQTAVSLNVNVDDDPEKSIINILNENQALGRIGRVDIVEENELRAEFEAVFNSLTQHQKRVYLALTESKTKTEIARELGMNRKSLYDAIRLIRKAFVKQGVMKKS